MGKQEEWSSSRWPLLLGPISDSRPSLTPDHRLIPNHDPWLLPRVTHDRRLTLDPSLTPNSDHAPPSRLTSDADYGPRPRVTHDRSMIPTCDYRPSLTSEPRLTPGPDSSPNPHCPPWGVREYAAGSRQSVGLEARVRFLSLYWGARALRLGVSGAPGGSPHTGPSSTHPFPLAPNPADAANLLGDLVARQQQRRRTGWTGPHLCLHRSG